MEITNAGDLRIAYLQTFDAFGLTPGDIVESSEGRVNMRYARELLGTLTEAGLLAVTNVNDEEDVWQVVDPGTYDDITRDEAEARIDAWLSQQHETESSNTTARRSNTMTENNNHLTACLCGCGAQTKSHYKPGHDARHAGEIGRHVAATTENVTDRSLYADLPSEALVTKAIGIAQKARDKADAKAAREQEREARKAEKGKKVEPKPEPQVEQGTVKVGKTEYAAERDANGNVTYFKGDKTLKASATAAKTFTV